ncbi:uncharacterized protein LOC143368269 [Andrena cerasifolii]|uniref:uncharacterized protein LOC143368269 n=1 Tax=Andrena cerasifolii TaxID=2819439 RepID=UPI004037D326
MNQENILESYVLSQYTLERLNIIKEKLKKDAIETDPLWKLITGQKEEETCVDQGETTDEDEENEENDEASAMPDYIESSSTQFYFTQRNKNFDGGVKQASIQKFDIVESLFEELESSNGKLDLNQLENLLDEELVEVACELEKKLSITGIYNLCCSMNCMTLEQRMKYAMSFHTYLLLPKIIALEEPSRLLLSVITECVQKFPDDIQKLIFIPLLNMDLKDTSIVTAIANAFDPQRNIILLTEYLSHVKELKSWHLPILYNLISVKTDRATSDKLVQLLSKKALDFAEDKNFGKLALLFIKVHGNFSEQQKHSLWEITNINQTLFKKPMQNILKTL